MNKPCLLLLGLLITACAKKEGDSLPKKAQAKTFEMYEMSEMSLLMEQLYIDNQRLKERIEKGDTLGRFPVHFLRIHTAVMTDPGENDTLFKQQSALFIEAQQLIYADPDKAALHFNKSIDACINCHKVKCAGPIARIRKLYIK